MVELRLLASEEQVETLSEALLELNALSVSVEDADAESDAEQALFGEPGLPAPAAGWQLSRLVALFGAEAQATAAATALLAQDVARGARLEALRAVADQDWVRLTQSQFEPIRVGERI